jgi:hypothetical protein
MGSSVGSAVTFRTKLRVASSAIVESRVDFRLIQVQFGVIDVCLYLLFTLVRVAAASALQNDIKAEFSVPQNDLRLSEGYLTMVEAIL